MATASNTEYDSFFNAVVHGTVDDVREALTPRIDIHAERRTADEAHTALHMAAENGRVDIARFLLSQGADVNALTRARDGDSQPLHVAACAAHPAVVKLLLDSGAERHQTGFDEMTALALALERWPLRYDSRRRETVRVLVEYGLDVNDSAVLIRAVRSRDIPTMKYLFENGASINPRNPGDHSLLGVAARYANLETVQFLLQNGAVLSTQADGCPNPTLMGAAIGGNLDVVQLLLSHADEETILKSSDAVSWAAGYRHLEVVKVLLAAGMDLNFPDEFGRTALHNIGAFRRPRRSDTDAHRRDRVLVRFLLDQGADVNACDNLGVTVLHSHFFSATDPELTVVRWLLEAGADPNARDCNGRPPLHWLARNILCPYDPFTDKTQPHTIESASVEALQLMLDAGADADAKDWSNQTALHIMARGNLPSCTTGECPRSAFMLLLESGVEVGAVNANHQTAVDILHDRLPFTKTYLDTIETFTTKRQEN